MSVGHASIEAVSPLFEEWLERRYGVLTYRLTQVLNVSGGSCTSSGGRNRPDVTTARMALRTRWSTPWRCAPLGRNTAVSSWRLSAAANSRVRPWWKPWSGARGNGMQSPPSAKQSCWRRRWRDGWGREPRVPAAAGDAPGVGSRETTPGHRRYGSVDGEQWVARRPYVY